jgi:hypothetical protein
MSNPNSLAAQTRKDYADKARALADALFVGACMDDRDDGPCIKRERKRGLPRHAQTVRSFADFNPFGLCQGCRCYWFAEMAAQGLHRLYVETVKP